MLIHQHTVSSLPPLLCCSLHCGDSCIMMRANRAVAIAVATDRGALAAPGAAITPAATTPRWRSRAQRSAMTCQRRQAESVHGRRHMDGDVQQADTQGPTPHTPLTNPRPSSSFTKPAAVRNFRPPRFAATRCWNARFSMLMWRNLSSGFCASCKRLSWTVNRPTLKQLSHTTHAPKSRCSSTRESSSEPAHRRLQHARASHTLPYASAQSSTHPMGHMGDTRTRATHACRRPTHPWVGLGTLHDRCTEVSATTKLLDTDTTLSRQLGKAFCLVKSQLRANLLPVQAGVLLLLRPRETPACVR